MDSDDSCPICGIYQYQICSNLHSICYSCMRKIDAKDSCCPFRREKFTVAQAQLKKSKKKKQESGQQIQQEVLERLRLCPLGHRQGKFSHQSYFCNNCETLKSAHYKCTTCQYANCWSCLKPNHQELCGERVWVYDQRRQGSNICGAMDEVGRSCRHCSMRVCRRHDTPHSQRNRPQRNGYVCKRLTLL